MIPYPLTYIDTKGRVWHPYAVAFDSPDGPYECHIYAISAEHAELQLASLKENGRVSGQTIEIVGAK